MEQRWSNKSMITETILQKNYVIDGVSLAVRASTELQTFTT